VTVPAESPSAGVAAAPSLPEEPQRIVDIVVELVLFCGCVWNMWEEDRREINESLDQRVGINQNE
jgi:hypothetical protein